MESMIWKACSGKSMVILVAKEFWSLRRRGSNCSNFHKFTRELSGNMAHVYPFVPFFRHIFSHKLHHQELLKECLIRRQGFVHVGNEGFGSFLPRDVVHLVCEELGTQNLAWTRLMIFCTFIRLCLGSMSIFWGCKLRQGPSKKTRLSSDCWCYVVNSGPAHVDGYLLVHSSCRPIIPLHTPTVFGPKHV